MHSDPIADLLTRIRNASRAHHETVTLSHSKVKENILNVMKMKEFIEDYKTTTEGGFKILEITLKENPSISLKRVSKPGQRIYIKKEDLRTVKSGLGFQIISTSKGLMTNSQAKKQNLGGEIICEIC